MAQLPTRGAKANIPQWSAPRVECWTCGTQVTPEAVRQTPATPWFWAIPQHQAFLGFVPGACGGSGRLVGPVAL